MAPEGEYDGDSHRDSACSPWAEDSQVASVAQRGVVVRIEAVCRFCNAKRSVNGDARGAQVVPEKLLKNTEWQKQKTKDADASLRRRFRMLHNQHDFQGHHLQHIREDVALSFDFSPLEPVIYPLCEGLEDVAQQQRITLTPRIH